MAAARTEAEAARAMVEDYRRRLREAEDAARGDAAAAAQEVAGRGLHSSTFSAQRKRFLCEGRAFRSCLRGVWVMFRVSLGVLRGD